MIENSDIGELLWEAYKTEAGKKFFDTFIKIHLEAAIWAPNSNLEEHSVYYAEGRRSIAFMMNETITENMKPREDIKLT